MCSTFGSVSACRSVKHALKIQVVARPGHDLDVDMILSSYRFLAGDIDELDYRGHAYIVELTSREVYHQIKAKVKSAKGSKYANGLLIVILFERVISSRSSMRGTVWS